MNNALLKACITYTHMYRIVYASGSNYNLLFIIIFFILRMQCYECMVQSKQGIAMSTQLNLVHLVLFRCVAIIFMNTVQNVGFGSNTYTRSHAKLKIFINRFKIFKTGIILQRDKIAIAIIDKNVLCKSGIYAFFQVKSQNAIVYLTTTKCGSFQQKLEFLFKFNQLK